MKRTISHALAILIAASGLCHAGKPEQELTGVFRAAVGMQTEQLEIDGHGLIQVITLSGDALKGIPDGTRIWVSGTIVTGQYGSPDTEKQQQHPSQWMIVMRVTRCKRISKPFERPKEQEPQNKTNGH
jgi:hypothetical protein